MSTTMPEPVWGLDGDRVEEQLQEPLISLCENDLLGTSLGIWWLGLSASNAGGTISIPNQWTKVSHATLNDQKKKIDILFFYS